VCLLTDRLGEAEARYRYDAFGGLLAGATAPYNLHGPFGKELDPVSGLVYFGARWYDASVGRFTTPDPFPGTVTDPLTRNPYLFILANPVNFVDRWGLHPEEHRYVVEETEDYIEVWAWIWLASVETYRSYVVSRTPSEEVIRHVYRHLHQYRYINLRAERRVREDGSEYWETVKWIVYTYWATIEYREWLEVNDLIGPKREELGVVPVLGQIGIGAMFAGLIATRQTGSFQAEAISAEVSGAFGILAGLVYPVNPIASLPL